MECEINIVDCIKFSDAAFGLKRYINKTKEEIEEFTKEYGEKDILVESANGRLKDTIEARTDLLEIANRCNCNIDLETGELK